MKNLLFFKKYKISVLLIGALSFFVLGQNFLLFAQDQKKDDKKNTKKVEDEGNKLLAEKEKKKGPTFPGLDPAFLVLPKAPERSNMAKELLNDEVKKTVDKALKYLADSQSPNGSWSDTQYKNNTGVTALAVLAFMAQGSRPRLGKYGKEVDKGLDFLLNNVQGNGIIAAEGNNPLGPMYEHVLSSMALMFAYGDMPWRPQLQDVLAKSVQIVRKAQRTDGGWRYQISREGYSDMSVTANVLWFLRTGKKAGFTVDKESIDKGAKYIVDCAFPDGTFRYRYFGLHASPSLGGTGIIAVSNNGDLDHILIPRARDRLAYDYNRYTVDDLLGRRYYVYGAFYASVAMYSTGDKYWMPWYKKASEVLMKMQRPDGEMWDEYENTIYTTAMAAIILQAPYGYLPIYER